MQPCNSKSLLHFIYGQMEKLDKKEISSEDATAQAKLGVVALGLLLYETKRALTIKELDGTGIVLREIEGKAFDNTIPNANIPEADITT